MIGEQQECHIIGFPGPDLRGLLALRRAIRLYEGGHIGEGMSRVKRLMDADNPPLVRLEAAKWAWSLLADGG